MVCYKYGGSERQAENALAANCRAALSSATMRFADWIEYSKRRRVDVAGELGIGKAHVTDLCARRVQPSLDLADKINVLSDGAVSFADWRKDVS